MATRSPTLGTTEKPAIAGADPAKPKLVLTGAVAAPEAPALPELKRQELLALVVKRAGTKKKLAKPVVEAVLAVLGEALAEGRDLNLAPLGKIRINRARDLDNGRVLVARIRQGAGGGSAQDSHDDEAAKEVLAEPSE